MVVRQQAGPTTMGILLGDILHVDSETTESLATDLASLIRSKNPWQTIRASTGTYFNTVEPDAP